MPNVYKSCPKKISLEKWIILTPLQKLPNNVGNLGKMIVAIGFELLPKVQKIAQSGHTAYYEPGDTIIPSNLSTLTDESLKIVCA